MANVKAVSLTAPGGFSDYDSEAQAIERRKRYAEALRQGALEPTQGQMVSGIYVAPSWTQHAAKAVNAFMGAKTLQDSDDEEKRLAQRYRTDLANTLMQAQQAMVGTPERAPMTDPQELEQQADQGTPAPPNIPAVPGDLNRAAQAYMQHPATMGMGAQMANQSAMDARRQILIRQLLGDQAGASSSSPQPNPSAPGPDPSTAPPVNGAASAPGMPALAGVNSTAARFMLSGDAELKDFGKVIQDANKPTDRQRDLLSRGIAPGSPEWNAELGTHFNQGGAWQTGPGGVRLAPGYSQGAGEIKGAEGAASARNAPATVRLGSNQIETTQAIANALNTGFAPDDQTAIEAMTLAQRHGQRTTITVRPQPGQATQGQPTLRDTLERNFDAVVQPPGAQIGRVPGEAEKKFSETMGKEYGEAYAGLLRADQAAPATIGRYQQLGALLSQVKTGKYAGTVQQLKAAAKSAGLNPEALGIADDVAPAQAAAALSHAMSLELRNPAGGAGMPGAMSDADREFLRSMVPNVESDPQAIPMMIDYRTRLARREQDVARLARDYVKQRGAFDDGFYGELAAWSAQNPLFPEAKPAQPGQPQPRTPRTGSQPQSRQFQLDGGRTVNGTLDPATGKYFVIQGGRKFFVEE